MHAVVAATIFIVDQVVKGWVTAHLPLGRPISVLPPVLYFTHVQNPGAAFTLFADVTWLLISVAVLVGLVAWMYRAWIREQSDMFRWGVTLALSGAAGNLVDRLRFGKVIDFIDLRVWPVFNIADSCIVVGVGLLLWAMWHEPHTGGKSGA